jgi:superfamily II DNA helicase RecQ
LMQPEVLISKSMEELEDYWESNSCCIKGLILDEAHLILQWGLYFRDSYLVLGTFIAKLREHNSCFCVLVMSGTLTNSMEAKLRRFLSLRELNECYTYRSNNTPPHFLLSREHKGIITKRHNRRLLHICIKHVLDAADATLVDESKRLRGVFIFIPFRSVRVLPVSTVH